jgi:hypothetical protein
VRRLIKVKKQNLNNLPPECAKIADELAKLDDTDDADEFAEFDKIVKNLNAADVDGVRGLNADEWDFNAYNDDVASLGLNDW